MIPSKTFLINVASRIDRLQKAEETARKFGIAYEVVGAVTPDDFDTRSRCLLENAYAGACWFSHAKAWKLLLESKSEYAMVMEDDFLPRKGFNLSKVQLDFEQMNCDLLQIGFLTEGILNHVEIFLKNSLHIIFKTLYTFSLIFKFSSRVSGRLRIERSRKTPWAMVPSDFQPGTHFYVLNRRAAEMLLKFNDPVLIPADAALHIVAETGAIDICRYRKSLVQQLAQPSSITYGRF